MKLNAEKKLTKYVSLAIALQLGAYEVVQLKEQKNNAEIANLIENTKSDEKFDVKDLIVWETKDIAGENHTYILEETNTDNIYEEYHHNFKAIAKKTEREVFSNPG